ncbi:MAG: hypothetical protein IJ075_02100 [Lachnospiraceae bacterium]|nr:hypothetical protein [Lachnospiraceae bacterium]
MPKFTLVKGNRSSGEKSADWEILKHRIKKIMRVVAFVAALVFVIWLIHRLYQNTTFNDYEILSKTMRQDSDTSKYLAYNGHVLKLSRDGAEAFEGNGKAIWNVTYEMQNPQAATCEDFVAIADEMGTEIYVASAADDMNKISTKLPILDLCVSKQGVVAAVLEDSGTSWVRLFDKSGEELASIKCSMAESGYPMDISLSPSGYLLAVAYTRVEGDSMRSSIAFYNFGDVGANESDHYMSGYDFAGTMIPRVKFLNDSTAFAMGTDKMIIFSGDQKPEKKYEYSFDTRVKGVFYSEDRIVLVRESAIDGGYSASVFNLSGEELLSIPFDLDYIDVQVSGKRIVIYSDTHMLIYDMRGTIKYDGALDDSTLLVSTTDNARRYILVNRESVKLIQLVK